jgi:hypothetical protein
MSQLTISQEVYNQLVEALDHCSVQYGSYRARCALEALQVDAKPEKQP